MMTSTIDTRNRLTPELQVEFDRFVAIVEETPYEPFPVEELEQRRQRRQGMRNANRREGLDGGPLSDLLGDYLLEQRVPGDVGVRIFDRFETEE